MADIEMPVFSPSIEKALAEVLRSDDPLDQADFDPIAYVNENFPDEASLSGGKLENFLRGLHRRTRVISDNISKEVREHSNQRNKTKRAVQSATQAIEELFEKINSIKDKAAQSELMVQEICQDIKSLDAAKKNLGNTIKALQNVHMLVSAVDRLELMAKQKNYREVAKLLRAAADFFLKFEPYKEVPKIRSLNVVVERVKVEIKEAIFDEFRRSFPISAGDETDATLAHLSEACEVLDVLDPAIRNQLISWFIKQQLDPYNNLYDLGKDGGTLEQTERRFVWLRKALREYDDLYSRIFPVTWDVPATMSRDFCLMTHGHLSKILKAKNGAFDITALIKALQKSKELERELNNRFGPPSDEKTKRDVTDPVDRGLMVVDIKVKYQLREKEKTKDKSGKLEPPHYSNIRFERLISEAFTPYMGGFVELERNNLQALITKFAEPARWAYPPEGLKPRCRLDASDELLLYIKKSIERCSSLTVNQTFRDLYLEYKSGLSAYCKLLVDHLSPNDDTKSLDSQEMGLNLRIVNTAEYFAQLIPSIEEKIKSTIEPHLREQVAMEDVKEEFSGAASKGIQVVANGTQCKLNRVLVSLTKLPWGTWEAVGDQSDYVNQINAIFREDVPIVSELVSPTYHSYFCSQMSQKFINAYTAAIFKCKRIGELGGQQMALDAITLTSILLSIPEIRSESDEKDEKRASPKKKTGKPTVYSRFVKREMGKIEGMLKTLACPPERMVVTFTSLLREHAKPEDLVKLMNLRGIKRSEQQSLVEAYNASVNPTERLSVDRENEGGLRKFFLASKS